MEINQLKQGHRADKGEKGLEPKTSGIFHYTSYQLGDVQKTCHHILHLSSYIYTNYMGMLFYNPTKMVAV